MFLWVLVISWTLLSVQSAPAGVKSLLDIVKSDNRTEELRKNKFVRECEMTGEFSKSLCYSMHDVAITFYSSKLDLRSVESPVDTKTFCEQFTQSVPETANDESSIAFKDKALWLKVALKEDGKTCEKNCIIDDRINYEPDKVAPVCRFLYEQYAFLNSLNANTSPALSAPAQQSVDTKQTIAKPIFVDSEETSVVQPVPAAHIEHLNASHIEPIPQATQKAINETVAVTDAKKETVEVVNVPTTKVQQQKPTEKQINPSVDVQSKPIAKSTPATEAKKTNPSNVDLNTNVEDGVAEQDIDGDDEPSDQDMDGKDDAASADDDENKDIVVSDNAIVNYDDENDSDVGHVDIGHRNSPKEVVESDDRVEEVQHKKVEHVNFEEDPDSNFFTYLCAVMFLCVLLYILHQNRHKILALVLEGRRGNRRGRERTRNGSKAAYSKLDCNLEEAITSKKSLNGKSMDVIY